LDMIQVVVFASAIFAFVYLLVLQPHKIDGLSMSPNFPDREYLLTDKVTYRFNEPKRGDVVVFKAPTSPDEKEFIKRIIGLPGDAVSLRDGQFYINDVLLEEEYIASNIFTSGGRFLEEGSRVVVPADNFFVVGDNRPHSSDSRAWGFIEKEAITGRAWVVYWPVENVGTVKPPVYNF